MGNVNYALGRGILNIRAVILRIAAFGTSRCSELIRHGKHCGQKDVLMDLYQLDKVSRMLGEDSGEEEGIDLQFQA